MLGVDLLVEMLIRNQSEVLFGVPGDTNVRFYAALRRNGERISHVMARDERNAGYMADAYARVSGKVGIVEVPSGAGPMYALPAVAEANLSAAPLLLLTFETAISKERRGLISELDGATLFHSITKDSYQVKYAQLIPDAIRRAFRVATSGRPGAVHLGIPEDILEEEVDPERVSLHVEPECAQAPARPGGACASDLNRLQKLLSEAERPLMIAGGGTNRSGAGPDLARVSEALGVPVVASITGQGAVPDSHPNYVGVIGDNGFHPVALDVLEKADLIIVLGSRLGSVITRNGTSPSPGEGRHIIQVDLDEAIIGDSLSVALSIHADVGAVLEQILGNSPIDSAPAAAQARRTWLAAVHAESETSRQRTRSALSDLTGDAPLRAEVVMRELQSRLDRPTVLVADPGTPTPYLNRYLELPESSDYVMQRGYGGLGYALPGAVGAWKAAPEKRLIAMFGDGSYGMNATELETLARLRVPALLMHFNNGTFGLIKTLQKLKNGNAVSGVDFTALDGARIAEAFGVKAWRVVDLPSLEVALDEALSLDEPAFLDLAVESIADFAAPLAGLLERLGHAPSAYGPESRIRI